MFKEFWVRWSIGKVLSSPTGAKSLYFFYIVTNTERCIKFSHRSQKYFFLFSRILNAVCKSLQGISLKVKVKIVKHFEHFWTANQSKFSSFLKTIFGGHKIFRLISARANREKNRLQRKKIMTYTLHSCYFLHVDDGIVMYSVARVQMFHDDIYTGFFPLISPYRRWESWYYVERLFKCFMTTSTLFPPVNFSM